MIGSESLDQLKLKVVLTQNCSHRSNSIKYCFGSEERCVLSVYLVFSKKIEIFLRPFYYQTNQGVLNQSRTWLECGTGTGTGFGTGYGSQPMAQAPAQSLSCQKAEEAVIALCWQWWQTSKVKGSTRSLLQCLQLERDLLEPVGSPIEWSCAEICEHLW